MEILVETDYGIIYRQKNQDYWRYYWKKLTSKDDLRAFLDIWIESLNPKTSYRFLCDSNNLAPVDVQEQLWIAWEYAPRFRERVNDYKIALLLPRSFWTRLTMEQAMERLKETAGHNPNRFKFFETEIEAVNWLHEPVIESSFDQLNFIFGKA